MSVDIFEPVRRATVSPSQRMPASRPRTLAALFAIALLASPRPAAAWIFPEHRDITNQALVQLPPASRAALEQLWVQARSDFAAPLCAAMAAGDQGLAPACVDYSAWPALAGDHSCSARELLKGVMPSDWVLPVSRVAAETKADLASARTHEQKANRLATANLHLQVADSAYATRAGANTAHFLLPREGDDVVVYLRSAVRAGAPLNAIGMYAQYHLAALATAHRLAQLLPGDVKKRAEGSRRVLALEAYAIHWIEDSFAAGHVIGTWGSTPWRKGTHDYYNEFGFDGTRWTGEPIVLFGDANMKLADLERASAVVEASLEQLAQALDPADPLATASEKFGLGPEGAYIFDSCREEVQPAALSGDQPIIVVQMSDILRATPVPGRGEGEVHVPRFREELGPFIGIFGAMGGGVSWGGLVSDQARGSATLAAGARFGFGAESLTGTPGTATAYIEGGIRMATAELHNCSDCDLVGSSKLFPAAPARTGLRLGLRLPFWLIPGDVLLLAPVLALVSPTALSDVGVAAASGGLLPYERAFLTGAGTFQLVVGREVAVTLYGYLGKSNVPLYIAPIGTFADDTTEYGVVSQKSMAIDLPVIEWTPFRAFATQLTFAACLQLGFGFEVPLAVKVLYPEDRGSVSVPLAWNVFLRIQFDARYFVGAREDLRPPNH
jgi:hypothetical protein